jgi:hypothetical protein
MSKFSTTKAAAKLESVFASAALSIIKPIAICALLKFKEVRAIYSIKFNLTAKIMGEGIVNWCKDSQYFDSNIVLRLNLALNSKYTEIL